MIELTHQQRQELQQAKGDEIRVTDPDTGQHYVLVREETYAQLKRLLYHDDDWTPEEQLRLLADSGKRAGWDDPAMDEYDTAQSHAPEAR